MHPLHRAHEFCGQIQRCGEMAGIRFMDASYQANLRTTPHCHANMSMCLVLQGAFTHTYGRQTVQCKPSTLLFSTPNSTHSESFERAGANCFIFELRNQWIERLHESSLRLDQPSHFSGGLPSSLAYKMLRERKWQDGASELAMEGLLCELLAAICRYHPRTIAGEPPRTIARAREMLHSEWQRNIGISELAHQVGVPSVYLVREFRRHYRCSPAEYLRRRRIDYVCGRLRSSNVSITAIAQEAGFFDHSHLCRVFAKQMGMSPTAFRQAVASAI